MNHNQIGILKTEISTDPLSRGYSGMTDLEVADDLNTVYRTKVRDYISGSEILNEGTDDAEFEVLTETQKIAWTSLCGVDSVDTGSGVARAREKELFGPGTNTRAKLIALKSYDVSRATELGLPTVYEGNVQEARL